MLNDWHRWRQRGKRNVETRSHKVAKEFTEGRVVREDRDDWIWQLTDLLINFKRVDKRETV